ncbi:MAG: hypothetical protein ACYC77_05300 [Coriobacteriia bacterium]
MEWSGCVVIVIVWLMGGVAGVAAYQIFVRQRNPARVTLISLACTAVLTVGMIRVIDAKADLAPVLTDIAATAGAGLALMAAVVIVRRWRRGQ